MKVTMHGPMSGVGPAGIIQSWGPNEVVTVDDADEAAVEFYRSKIAAGSATLIAEPTAAPESPAPPAAEPTPPPAGEAKTAAAAKTGTAAPEGKTGTGRG